MRNLKILAGILVCMVVMSCLPSGVADSNVESVYHQPKVLLVDQALKVYLKVKDTSKIDSVTMHFCKIKPDLICYMPIDMTPSSGNWYTATSDTMKNLGIKSGETVGYNISISYTDKTKDEIPHVPNEFTNLTVEEPVAGSFYFSVAVVDQVPTSNVLSVYHTPEKVDYEKPITIFIRLNDVSKVKNIRVKVCQIEPGFKCFPEMEMTSRGSGWYNVTTSSMKGYGISQPGKGGYNITINYTTDTSDSVPHKPNEFSNMTVVEIQGKSFFTFNIESPPPPPENKIPWGEVPLVILIVGVAMICTTLMRGRKDA